MYKRLIIVIISLMSLSVSAQRYITVYMQDYQINGKSLYWNMKYGLKNFITWDKIDEYHYFNKEENVYLYIYLYPDDDWMDVENFIDTISIRDDSALYIIAGHNQLFGEDKVFEPTHRNCSDNMLFGCITESTPWYCIDNSLVSTTDFIAPEGYAVWYGIIGWTHRYDSKTIRSGVSDIYAKYQKISKREARIIFNGSLYCN